MNFALKGEIFFAMIVGIFRCSCFCWIAARDFIKRHEICVRVIGDLSLAPTDVRKAAERAMTMTEKHRKLVPGSI